MPGCAGQKPREKVHTHEGMISDAPCKAFLNDLFSDLKAGVDCFPRFENRVLPRVGSTLFRGGKLRLGADAGMILGESVLYWLIFLHGRPDA